MPFLLCESPNSEAPSMRRMEVVEVCQNCGFFGVLKSMVDTLAALAKTTFALKAGSCESSDMNKHVKNLQSGLVKFKDRC